MTLTSFCMKEIVPADVDTNSYTITNYGMSRLMCTMSNIEGHLWCIKAVWWFKMSSKIKILTSLP